MSANQARYPVQVMARTLGVSRSGFYASQGRGPSARAEVDADLVKDIKRIHKMSKKTYGAPRIHAELAEDGTRVGRKRIERLMRANGIVGVSRRKFVTTTVRDERVRPALDLVDRNFYAEEPNQLWGLLLWRHWFKPNRRRHHVCANLGWLLVSRGRAGCILQTHSRLGNGQ